MGTRAGWGPGLGRYISRCLIPSPFSTLPHSSLTTTGPLFFVSPHIGPSGAHAHRARQRRARKPTHGGITSSTFLCPPGNNQTIKPVPSETPLSSNSSSGGFGLPVTERDIDATVDATRRLKQGPKATTWTHFLLHWKDSVQYSEPERAAGTVTISVTTMTNSTATMAWTTRSTLMQVQAFYKRSCCAPSLRQRAPPLNWVLQTPEARRFVAWDGHWATQLPHELRACHPRCLLDRSVPFSFTFRLSPTGISMLLTYLVDRPDYHSNRFISDAYSI